MRSFAAAKRKTAFFSLHKDNKSSGWACLAFVDPFHSLAVRPSQLSIVNIFIMKGACYAAAALAVVASSFVAAHPPAKRCDTQAGSDSLGLPTVDGTFTAMSGAGVTWDTKVTDASSTFFEPNGASVVLHVPLTFSDANADTFGFFAIVDQGNITFDNASLTNPCASACPRVVCQNSPGDFAVTVVNSDPQTCDQTRVRASMRACAFARVAFLVHVVDGEVLWGSRFVCVVAGIVQDVGESL